MLNEMIIETAYDEFCEYKNVVTNQAIKYVDSGDIYGIVNDIITEYVSEDEVKDNVIDSLKFEYEEILDLDISDIMYCVSEALRNVVDEIVEDIEYTINS